eukprot:scaffold102777_cov60-Phaeocystis_antarctica.AAC.1
MPTMRSLRASTWAIVSIATRAVQHELCTRRRRRGAQAPEAGAATRTTYCSWRGWHGRGQRRRAIQSDAIVSQASARHAPPLTQRTGAAAALPTAVTTAVAARPGPIAVAAAAAAALPVAAAVAAAAAA